MAPLRRFDEFQHGRQWLSVPMAVVKKFSDDQAGKLAALVAYYAFLSLFPLLLVFVTVLGFVLAGDPSALHSAKDSVLGRFPVIGDAIRDEELKGDTLALVVGIVLSLFAGLGVTQAAVHALDRVWGVPNKHRLDFIQQRLHGLFLLICLGGMFLVASTANGLLGAGLGGTLSLVVGIIGSLVLNFALFLASFKLLCSAETELSWLVPGAAVSAVAWSLLQALGGIFIAHVANSKSAYGTFALVLGVLAWLHLGSYATVYSAELNVVLARRIWPRWLFRDEDQQPGATASETAAEADPRSLAGARDAASSGGGGEVSAQDGGP